MAEIFRKVEDADADFLIEKCGGFICAPVVHGDDLGSRHGGAGFGDHSGNILFFVKKRDDEGQIGGHDGLFHVEEGRDAGEKFWKISGTQLDPDPVENLRDEPRVEHGKGNGGQDVGGIVVAGVNAAEGGQGDEVPGPAHRGAPDKAGAGGRGGGVGNVGGWEGAAVFDILFRNAGDPDSGLPVVFLRAWADFANPFHGLVGAGAVEEIFDGVADERIANGDTEHREDDPDFDPIPAPQEQDDGGDDQDGSPEMSIGQQIEKLIEQGMVKSPVDPVEHSEIQRINLGDQVHEAKLVKMVRQVVCAVLLLSFLSSGWAQNRNITSDKDSGGKSSSGEEVIPTPRQMQNFLWRTLVMKDLRLKGQVQSGERKIPILVRTKERLLQFEFQDRPLQIRVRFAPEGSLIQRRTKANADWEVVTGVEKTKAVAGTDLAYEDLGIDFLRWPDPQPKGEDSVMMLDCWVYEVNPPVESNYAKVRYWISKTYKTMIRADGLNSRGEAIKRFTFNSVIEAEDTVVIGEMKVAKLTPGTDVSASRTFVQIETVEKGSGL